MTTAQTNDLRAQFRALTDELEQAKADLPVDENEVMSDVLAGRIARIAVTLKYVQKAIIAEHDALDELEQQVIAQRDYIRSEVLGI